MVLVKGARAGIDGTGEIGDAVVHRIRDRGIPESARLVEWLTKFILIVADDVASSCGERIDSCRHASSTTT
jgi:hypothetical protein